MAGITASADLDARTLNRFTAGLLEHGGKRGALYRHSVASYVRSVNLFLRWCRREAEIGDVQAQAPKVPRRALDVLTRKEIDRLEDVAPNERDKVIVRVLADTGLRAGELVGLQEHDLVERGRDRFLSIRGRSQGGGAKGDRARLVPVQPQLYRRLQRLARGRPDDARGEWIFLALRRRPGGSRGRLTVSGIEQVLHSMGARAGVTKRIFPHLMRHSFATEMLNRGMDAITLSRILGHTSLVMIQRTYAHQRTGTSAMRCCGRWHTSRNELAAGVRVTVREAREQLLADAMRRASSKRPRSGYFGGIGSDARAACQGKSGTAAPWSKVVESLYRLRRSLTQEVLAGRIGRSTSGLSQVERGIRSVENWRVILDLSDVLQCDPRDLVGQPLNLAPNGGVPFPALDDLRGLLTGYEWLLQAVDAPPVDSAGSESIDELQRRAEDANRQYQAAEYEAAARGLVSSCMTPSGSKVRCQGRTTTGRSTPSWLRATRRSPRP
jgi:integrase/recombinase XerD